MCDRSHDCRDLAVCPAGCSQDNGAGSVFCIILSVGICFVTPEKTVTDDQARFGDRKGHSGFDTVLGSGDVGDSVVIQHADLENFALAGLQPLIVLQFAG